MSETNINKALAGIGLMLLAGMIVSLGVTLWLGIDGKGALVMALLFWFASAVALGSLALRVLTISGSAQ